MTIAAIWGVLVAMAKAIFLISVCIAGSVGIYAAADGITDWVVEWSHARYGRMTNGALALLLCILWSSVASVFLLIDLCFVRIMAVL